MVALIDLDSLIYSAVYRVVSISQMRKAIKDYGKEVAKQWLKEEVYNEGINRLENQILQVQNEIVRLHFEEIKSFEIYITTCSKSFRKELSSTYKANRKTNKYVWILREHYKYNGAFYSDTLEADDLISIRAKELGEGNYIIVSPDKDLKQISGYYFSYYRKKSFDEFGNPIINEIGFQETEFKQKSIEYISKEKANYLFWEQVLMGDSSDNIKGLKRVGKKTAEKILKDSKVHWFKVAREYISRGQKEDFYINYKLLKLVEDATRR